jgi:dihydroorotase
VENTKDILFSLYKKRLHNKGVKRRLNMLIIKNGRVIDPLNKVDEVLDVAVEGRKILKVEKNIPTEETDNVIDAQGCYVVPGLIDHHAHLKPLSRIGIPSEAQCFAAGVTTAVDAGSCGPANFPYHYGILKRLRLGIKAYLNVATTGLDTLPGNVEDVNPEHWDRQAIKDCFAEYSDVLVGLKLRTSKPIVKDLGYDVIHEVVKLADELDVPVMVHCTNPPGELSELLDILRPGDTLTHMYMNIGPCLVKDGRVIEAAYRARERGVKFEAADARAHFGFSTAVPAIKEGFYPDFIATDGTRLSMNLRPTTFNEAMQLAKYTALGIPFDKVLECATVNPARDLGILDQAGSLTAGHPADIAVLRPVKKDTVHGDRPNGNPDQHTMVSHMLYQPVFTVKNGEMVFRDLTF